MLGDVVFFLGVNLVVGYATWHGFSTHNSGIRRMPLGIPFDHVARVVFVISGLAYAAAGFRDCVWNGRPWSSFVLACVDAVIFSAAVPEAMHRMIGHVREWHGGIREFALALGVPAEAIDRLRAELIE